MNDLSIGDALNVLSAAVIEIVTAVLLTAVECTEPPVLTHSTLQDSNPTSTTYFYGDIVTYVCSDFYYYDYDANYDVIWEYNSTCDETGNWIVQSELCQREALFSLR